MDEVASCSPFPPRSLVIQWGVFLTCVIVPTGIAGQPNLFKLDDVTSVVAIGAAVICLGILSVYAVLASLIAAAHIYLQGYKTLRFGRSQNAAVYRLSENRVFTALKFAAVSYLITIYCFALTYCFSSNFKPAHFKDPIEGMVTSIYFSIVTMATVGYGDITPRGWFAQVLVSLEILVGVGFSIFFFSIIAGFVRDGIGSPKVE
jgi:hypothetical protein